MDRAANIRHVGVQIVRPIHPRLPRDPAVGLVQIEVAVVVEVDPAHAEAGEGSAGEGEAGRGGPIGEAAAGVDEQAAVEPFRQGLE